MIVLPSRPETLCMIRASARRLNDGFATWSIHVLDGASVRSLSNP